MTYMFVGALTALQVLAWAGWFIVEIIIHCLNSDYTQGSFLQILTEQSMYVFMYHGVILAGTLAALHLAASVKTRASRFCSMVVQIFGWLAWFYELYFIIPAFKDADISQNMFCGAPLNNPLADIAVVPGFGHPVSICNTARAVAAFSVIMQFFQSIITVYAIANAFIAPQLEDGTRKEIIEEDDAEVATVVSANPAGYEHINRSVSLLSYMNLFFVFVSLAGYAILVWSFINVVRYRGVTLNSNGDAYPANSVISETWNMLGDFMLSWNFRQLSLTLALALGASSYAAFRHNRGIQAGALFLTVMTTLQWWSFIIYSGRYLTQYVINPVGGDFISKRAQEAMFAGMCIILAGETLRAPILLARYYSYVPVTRNNVIPTYIRGAFATASWVPTVLFILVSLATFAWWVLEFVSQCIYGIWNDTPNRIASQHVVSDTMFIWQTLFILAAFIPEFFSERTKTLASKQAALAVNVVVHCAWFLLMWPWTYATIHKTGFWLDGFNNYAAGAWQGPTPQNQRIEGFCDTTYGAANCRIPQGAAILAVIIGGHYVFLALWQIARILSMLPTPGQVATVDGTVVDALPPTVGVQKSLGWMTWLMLFGLLIWSLTAIDVGSGYDGFIAWTFNQLPAVSQVGQVYYYNTAGALVTNSLLPVPLYAYTYSIAFNALVIIGFTAWAASEMASNPVVANWHAWRTMVTGLSGLLMTFFVPILIIVCRYINWGTYQLDGVGKAVAAGVIIMCIGEFFLYICALLAQRSPLIALPAAINNTTQPAGIKSEVPLQQVVVTDPTKAGVHQHAHNNTGVPAAGVNQYHTQHTEPTVVTQNPQMAHTREYSGNQVPPV